MDTDLLRFIIRMWITIIVVITVVATLAVVGLIYGVVQWLG